MKSRLLVIGVIALCLNGGFAKNIDMISECQPTTASPPADTVSRFLLKNANGNIIDVSTLRGKIVVLNFWALSCVPCKTEMPTINKLRLHFRNDTNVVILPVDVGNEMANSTGYMRDNGFVLDVYTIASPVPSALFRGVLPTTVIIDRKGRVELFHEGEGDYAAPEFIDYMDRLVSRR